MKTNFRTAITIPEKSWCKWVFIIPRSWKQNFFLRYFGASEFCPNSYFQDLENNIFFWDILVQVSLIQIHFSRSGKQHFFLRHFGARSESHPNSYFEDLENNTLFPFHILVQVCLIQIHIYKIWKITLFFQFIFWDILVQVILVHFSKTWKLTLFYQFRFRDIFDDYVIGMKEAVEAEEGAKDK